jgi:hypothetical protein
MGVIDKVNFTMYTRYQLSGRRSAQFVFNPDHCEINPDMRSDHVYTARTSCHIEHWIPSFSFISLLFSLFLFLILHPSLLLLLHTGCDYHLIEIVSLATCQLMNVIFHSALGSADDLRDRSRKFRAATANGKTIPLFDLRFIFQMRYSR